MTDSGGARRPSAGMLAVGGLALGLTTGVVVAWSGSATARAAASWIEPLGTVWVDALRMTVVPLVASLLIATLASGGDVRALGRLGRRAVMIFLAFLFAIAIIGVSAVPPVFSLLHVDPGAASMLRSDAGNLPAATPPGFAQWVTGLVPANVVRAAADSAMLPIIAFACLFGLALGRTPERAARLVAVLRAVSDAMIEIVRAVLRFAPIGAFALAVPLGLHLGNAAAAAIAFYVGAMVGFHVAVGVLLYAVVPPITRTPVSRFARAMLPAQIVVVSTRSSLAALPAMLDGAQRELDIPADVAGFALPLGVALLRANIAMSWLIQVCFLSKLYGVPLTTGAVLGVAAASIALSFSVPGIPSGGFLIAMPYVAAIGLPVESIGILIAVDAIPDIFKTLLNITAHVSAALVLARLEPAPLRVPVAVSG